MTVTSNSVQTSRRWSALAPYLAFLFGGLILLFVIFNNKNLYTSEQSQNTRSPEHSFETTGAPAQAAAQDSNALAGNGTVSAQSDPFKVFLETHKNIQPAVNVHPMPQTPEAIRDVFKEAVEKQKTASLASPFATSKNPNSADGSQ
jgi:hypothetical protein